MQKSVIDNVCFPLYIQGKKKKEARAKALELLEIVGLQDRAKAYPAQLFRRTETESGNCKSISFKSKDSTL